MNERAVLLMIRFSVAAKLEAEIKKNLAGLGYGE